MSTVVVASPTTRVITSSKAQQPANILIKKLDSSLKLQQISNVNSDNISDGYSLVYNAATNSFVFSATPQAANIDGGTY